MRSLIMSLTAASLIAPPGFAATLEGHPSSAHHRVGAFAGARLRVAMGGETAGRPRLGLAVAGMDYRQSSDGRISARLGEGMELGLAADRKLRLSLAGQPVGIRPSLQGSDEDEDEDGGISTALLIAGGVVVALGIGALLFVDAVNDASE
jgi:hypothetical protein